MNGSTPMSEHRLAEVLSDYIDRISAGEVIGVDEIETVPDVPVAELRSLLETATLLAESAGGFQPTISAAESFASVEWQLLREDERTATRDAIESGTGSLPVDRRPDILLLVLLAAREVWGNTKLQKLLFLVGKETNAAEVVPDYFIHVAYNYGPFDDAVNRDVEALEDRGLLTSRPPRSRRSGSTMRIVDVDRGVDAVYRLTTNGRMIAEALERNVAEIDPSLLEGVRGVIDRYGKMPLEALLRHVYSTYPESAEESLIRDQVLGDGEDGR